MSDIAIRVENLGKLYRIGRAQQRHDTLRDALEAGLRASLERLRRYGRGPGGSIENTIWALRDISFEVERGEVIGIIGRNGAGKSTLLKILSRITKPTKGYAKIYGRVGSLLEVGTGFHPELSGRENIFLNGAILGMKKRELDEKFDEIVDFSGVEKFIDTPVKRYSSGMKVRLAFSVAAHLEPEIMLVDEVLAVGDTEFQKKCLGKMGEVANEGRAVIFVSHNMGAVQTLCQRGIFLQDGAVLADDIVTKAIAAYLSTLEQEAPRNLAERTDRRGKGQVRLTKVEIFGDYYRSLPTLVSGRPARFVFHVNALLPRLACVFSFYNEFGQLITNFESAVRGPGDSYDPEGSPKFVCELDELLLAPGHYRMNVAIRNDGELQDLVEAAAILDVEEGLLRGRRVKRHPRIKVRMPHHWTLPIQD